MKITISRPSRSGNKTKEIEVNDWSACSCRDVAVGMIRAGHSFEESLDIFAYFLKKESDKEHMNG